MSHFEIEHFESKSPRKAYHFDNGSLRQLSHFEIDQFEHGPPQKKHHFENESL